MYCSPPPSTTSVRCSCLPRSLYPVGSLQLTQPSAECCPRPPGVAFALSSFPSFPPIPWPTARAISCAHASLASQSSRPFNILRSQSLQPFLFLRLSRTGALPGSGRLRELRTAFGYGISHRRILCVIVYYVPIGLPFCRHPSALLV